MKPTIRRFPFLVFLFLASVFSVRAQSDSSLAHLSGTLVDSSGAGGSRCPHHCPARQLAERVMMSLLQNAFANSSSSLIQSKIMGNLVFVLLPPLSHLEFFAAYALSSVLRGSWSGSVCSQ